MIAVPSFDCCPHMAQLRESLEHADLERVRLEIETAQLQQEIEELIAVIESELDDRNHERQFDLT